MVFSEDDIKGYGSRRLMPVSWKSYGLYEILARLRKTGTTKRKHGIGRTRTVHNEWCDQHKACVMAKARYFEHKM